jgi:hypothetical protein
MTLLEKNVDDDAQKIQERCTEDKKDKREQLNI